MNSLVLLHPAAKVWRSQAISLDGLLDYEEDDREEATVELSLAAEALSEALAAGYGSLIADHLLQERCVWPARAAPRSGSRLHAHLQSPSPHSTGSKVRRVWQTVCSPRAVICNAVNVTQAEALQNICCCREAAYKRREERKRKRDAEEAAEKAAKAAASDSKPGCAKVMQKHRCTSPSIGRAWRWALQGCEVRLGMVAQPCRTAVRTSRISPKLCDLCYLDPPDITSTSILKQPCVGQGDKAPTGAAAPEGGSSKRAAAEAADGEESAAKRVKTKDISPQVCLDTVCNLLLANSLQVALPRTCMFMHHTRMSPAALCTVATRHAVQRILQTASVTSHG